MAGGFALFSPLGLPKADAQYLNDAASSSTFGNNANTLGTMSASASTQSQPVGIGASIASNKFSLAGWQAYRNYRIGSLSGGSGQQIDSSEVGRFGQVRMTLGSSAAVTYDTNVNTSPTAPLADLSTSLGINLGFKWQATRRNELQLNLGLTYTKYLKYDQYNQSGLLISPYTGLDYRIYFMDCVLTFYDYPSITNGGGSQDPAVTNSVNFRQLVNRGGFSLIWHPNQVLFLTGVERSDILSLTNDEFNSQNSTAYSWYGIVSYDITPTTNTGLRLQSSATYYTQQVLNNSVTNQAGLFYQSRLTENTSIYIEAGIQTGEFLNTGQQTDTLVFQETNGVNTNVEGTLGGKNYSQPYFKFMVTNRLTRYLTHSLSLSREAAGSGVSNYQETNSASYGLQYRVNRVTTAGFVLNYESGTISRATNPIPYSNLSGQLDLTFRIMKNTDLGISFIYYKNELAELNANYTRQVFTLSMSHQF